MGQPLYLQLPMPACGKERLWWWFHPLRVTWQSCLASMAAWLSSTGISHHSLLPHITSTHRSTVKSRCCPGIAPQSLNSSSQPLHSSFPTPGRGDQCSCPGYVWLQQGLSDSHSLQGATEQLFHSQPLVFLLWLGQLPLYGEQTPASVPPPTEGRSSPTNTPVLFPRSYWVLRWSIYSFPLVRFSSPLSADVLHAVLLS